MTGRKARLLRIEKSARIVYNLRRAGVAELADALDSKSSGPKGPCGFDSLLRHALFPLLSMGISNLRNP